MTTYTDARKKFDGMKVGKGMTVQDMYVALRGSPAEDMTQKERSAISSFMSTAVRKGWAKKDGSTRPAKYEKLKDVPPRGGPRLTKKTPPAKWSKGDDLNEVQVGNAILAVIEKLTQKNKELRDMNKLLSAEVRDAVEAKVAVEKMLVKAKERISELHGSSGKGRKSVNLHELQSLTRQQA